MAFGNIQFPLVLRLSLMCVGGGGILVFSMIRKKGLLAKFMMCNCYVKHMKLESTAFHMAHCRLVVAVSLCELH